MEGSMPEVASVDEERAWALLVALSARARSGDPVTSPQWFRVTAEGGVSRRRATC
jgi:hypothetical protein